MQGENPYDLIKPIMQLTQLASFIVLGYVPHMIQENQEVTEGMC